MPQLLPNADDLARYGPLLAEARRIKGTSLGRDAWRKLKRNRVATAALAVLGTIALLALLVPLLPLQSPREQALDTRQFESPNSEPQSLGLYDLYASSTTRDATEADTAAYTARREALFGELNLFDRALLTARLNLFGDWSFGSVCGTDELGRDLLARLFWGARVSLSVGVVAALVSLVIGVSYGATSGYFGGRIDNAMMRLVDVLYSIPFIFVVIFIITILKEETIKATLREAGIDEISVFFVVIGTIYWLTMARVVRGQVLSLKQEQFVEAARTIGASRRRIIFLHLVPNLLPIVIVYLTLTIPSVMLFEAFLSFLGLGVSAPDVSWGLLANDGIQVITPLRVYWWVVVFPGIALATTLFALNFLGDGLRDALDPRMSKH
jgi:oligopeptide transport system permease protein